MRMRKPDHPLEKRAQYCTLAPILKTAPITHTVAIALRGSQSNFSTASREE